MTGGAGVGAGGLTSEKVPPEVFGTVLGAVDEFNSEALEVV